MIRHLLPIRLLLGAVGAVALSAAEVEPAAPPTTPDNEMRLTMTDAVVRALDANLEIKIERLKPAIAEQQRRFKLGAFDPHLTTHYTVESLETPQNTRDFFATGQTAQILSEDNIRTETNLTGLLPTGTTYKITVLAYSLKNTLNREALARFYPEYTTSTSLTLSQPLLRGFGIASTLAEARIAKSQVRSAEQALRGKIDEISADALDAYVEALYSKELIRVITDRISLAERLRDENEKRLKQGLMAPIDVMQAESTRAAAEIELVRAKAFLDETENRLRELLFQDFADAADTRFTFVDALQEVKLAESLPALRAFALERSAEYQVALQAVETEKLKVRYARNQMLPTVNIETSVGLNGLGASWSGGFSDYSKRSQPDYSVGLVADIPLGLHQERSNLREAMMHLRSAELEAKRDANHVISQVQTAYSRVQSAIARTEASSRAVKTAEAALADEEKRLTNGLTTSFNVLKLQDELSQARINRLEAIAEGQKAVIVLWGVVGVLLERFQIDATAAPHVMVRP
ncbi:MAG TPA: TolC family protein [Lacunisphaera sp.]|nr:TolC family protein [Lacunisphaera sp.]